MIPKGNQRGGGQQLAAHLMNSFDNDSVEVANLQPVEEFRRRADQKDRQRDGIDTGDTGREKRYRPAPVDCTGRR